VVNALADPNGLSLNAGSPLFLFSWAPTLKPHWAKRDVRMNARVCWRLVFVQQVIAFHLNQIT